VQQVLSTRAKNTGQKRRDKGYKGHKGYKGLGTPVPSTPTIHHTCTCPSAVHKIRDYKGYKGLGTPVPSTHPPSTTHLHICPSAVHNLPPHCVKCTKVLCSA